MLLLIFPQWERLSQTAVFSPVFLFFYAEKEKISTCLILILDDIINANFIFDYPVGQGIHWMRNVLYILHYMFYSAFKMSLASGVGSSLYSEHSTLFQLSVKLYYHNKKALLGVS